MIFDLLYLDGRALFGEPYERRRRCSASWACPARAGRPRPPSTTVRRSATRRARQGLPGIVAKRLDRPYDQETADWRLIPV